MSEIKSQVVAKLKASGIEIAEDAAMSTVKAAFEIIPAILAATPNKFDDLLIPLLAIIKPQILAAIDKLDGKVTPQV